MIYQRVSIKDFLRTSYMLFNNMNKEVMEHSLYASYFSTQIAQELDYKDKALRDIALAGFFNELGMFNPKDSKLQSYEHEEIHSIIGSARLELFSPFPRLANIVLNIGKNYNEGNNDVPMESLIIKASKIMHSALVNNDDLGNVIETLDEKILPNSLIDVLKRLDSNKVFEEQEDILFSMLFQFDDELLSPGEELEKALTFFSYILDFSSPQTSTHSFDVAKVTELIGKKFNLDKRTLESLRYSALCHDVGKLMINIDLIEKPSSLSKEEMAEVMNHALLTKKVMQFLGGLRTLLEPAFNHHERLNGTGYPLGLKESELTLSDCILQVADVFCALVQKRSYKEVFPRDKVISILQEEVNNHKLSKEVVDVVIENYQEFMGLVIIERRRHNMLREDFNKKVKRLLDFQRAFSYC